MNYRNGIIFWRIFLAALFIVIAALFLCATLRAQVAALHEATNTEGIHAYAIKQSKAPAVSASLVRIALGFEGVREHGNNAGPEVNKFLANVGLNPGYSWCMAFAQYCFDQALKANNITRGDLNKGAAVVSVFRRSIIHGRLLPQSQCGQRGQFMCFQHGRTALGHVAIVTANLGHSQLATIEGNTGPDGGRDGDGVYRKTRPLKGYRNLQTLGFLTFAE